MQRLLLAIALCAFLACVQGSADASVQPGEDSSLSKDLADLVEWKAFKQKFGKVYATHEEEVNRFAIFRENLKLLELKRSSFTSMIPGVTKFFDLTMEEFKQHFTPMASTRRPNKTINADMSYMKDFPGTWDWAQQGYVTPVKSLGLCGATWAMSAVDTLESVCKIAGYDLIPLSTLQIIDCDSKADGCNGGMPYQAYQYILDAGGIETESSYPYNGDKTKNCTADKQQFVPCQVNGYKNLTIEPSEENLMQFVFSNSPIIVCLDAAQAAFFMYTSGVITAAECPQTKTDHCLAVVGWNWLGGKRAWKLKNQWGPEWGWYGYVFLEMGANTCGMDETVAVAPCVKDVC